LIGRFSSLRQGDDDAVLRLAFGAGDFRHIVNGLKRRWVLRQAQRTHGA
jgi:hypothetical protein